MVVGVKKPIFFFGRGRRWRLVVLWYWWKCCECEKAVSAVILILIVKKSDWVR